ncbi:hypothetical protein KT71_000265 [Congregibacter litoralis KT71]|uniref:Uncharacterized protein n=1 Tax=Congregibacter litoralis KT71 TaxID=314285 RepID=V7HS42_9GAMM|nr:hypothetical protein KT71_000265 [Congregibacter litoralis KT71]
MIHAHHWITYISQFFTGEALTWPSTFMTHLLNFPTLSSPATSDMWRKRPYSPPNSE